uniref:Uncharacterized protein n=1 Tax=Ignisphaera aggregans TaxID=334771 RepID=A0A7J3JMY3_9CREN
MAIPNYIHKVIAVKAIKAGKHAFLEMPICARYRRWPRNS